MAPECFGLRYLAWNSASCPFASWFSDPAGPGARLHRLCHNFDMTAIERAVILKGGRRPHPGSGQGPAPQGPLIMLQPPTPLPAATVQHLFCRQAEWLMSNLASRLAESHRYAGAVVVGLEDQQKHISGDRVVHLATTGLLYGWLSEAEAGGDQGATVDTASPESFVQSIVAAAAAQVKKGASRRVAPKTEEGGEDGERTCAVVIDSVAWLVQQWGVRETVRCLGQLRRAPNVSPLLTIVHPDALSPVDRAALEDAASTSVYMHYCALHSTSSHIPDHGRCFVVRRSSSGRVQEGWDYYATSPPPIGQVGARPARAGLQVLERSACPLDRAEEAAEPGARDPEESTFLEDLSAKLRVGGGGERGQGEGQADVPLIYLEEGDVDDEDDDDGIDDDLDI